MKICAFVGDMYRDYSSLIISNLQRVALEHDHQIDFFGNCSVPSENPLHAQGLRSILSLPPLGDYDGIILCSDTLSHAGLDRELLERLISSTDLPPVVSIRADEQGFYSIVPDNRKIMHDISEYVIRKCGTDDIGFVTGRDELKDSAERRAGFEDAMHEAGYEVREDMIFHGNYWTTQGPQTADFFTKKDGTLPAAIICSNDYMALALMDELSARGFSIPKDTMITGIDNLAASALHSPSLTTSDIPESTLAEAAVDCLERVTSGEVVDMAVTVPGRLILRESTGDKLEEQDVDEMHRLLDAAQRNYYDKTRAFVLMESEYEDLMTYEDNVKFTLLNIQEYGIFDEFCFVKHCENDRKITGYFSEGKGKTADIHFPSSKLLPEELDVHNPGVRIFLPIFYKSEVYGYAMLSVDDEKDFFIDEKLEFITVLFGQTINRLRLYEKLTEANNVMDLYIKDALTGLYNRRGFEKMISNLFTDGTSDKYTIAVVSIDMDGLKYINDTFGHSAGDEALKSIAHCLSLSVNEREIAARMGGDEFEAVLILDNPGRLGQFTRAFRSAIKKANQEQRAEYSLSASIGSCNVSNWGSLMECMNKADKIMYIEKKTKKRAT
ncbi:MAG: GGDEF domain-containing protein [Clostridiales bacterium]|nr:GGDEF domain-containing protein [Clostridiales bacterium]